MPAQIANLVIEQGSTWIQPLVMREGSSKNSVPMDLAGCSAKMDARLNITDAVPVFSLTSPNGIIINVVGSTITLTMSATLTAALNFNTVGYDLEISDSGGNVKRALKGTISLIKEYTRS